MFFFVFNETGKGYGTQFERHRLEIVFVIESSAWLCLSCRWDQFLLCPRLTHSWCFSGVSKTTTTTTATTGSYIFFIWRDQFVLCSGLRLLYLFHMKRSWFCQEQQQFLYRHSPVSLWQTAAHWDLDGLTLFPVSVSPKVVSNRFQRIKDGRHWGAAGKVVFICMCVFVR